MRLLPRKITFQLTPLLDLLLIVIFAQFLEMRDETAAAKESAALKADENRAALRRTQSANEMLRTERDVARLKALDRERDIAALQNRLNADEDRQKLLREQRNLLAEQMSKLLGMPEKELAKALKPLFTRDAAGRAEAVKNIQQRIENLRKSDPHRILRHVVKYEELLKRADIWEIHVHRDNTATITIGPKTSTLSYNAVPVKLTGDKEKDDAELRRYFQELKQDFERKLFVFYKSLPQTKNVVIVLLSEGKNVSGFTYRAARDGIVEVGHRIATETASRVQVVSAELGQVPLNAAATPDDR